MRVEKKYLITEVEEHLKKSDYVILTNYAGITVDETAELRAQLEEMEPSSTLLKTLPSK